MNRVLLNQVEYCFDDEIAEYFHYDSKRKILEVGFGGLCYDGQYRSVPCCLRVTDWEIGKSRLHKGRTFQDLESNLGVVSLLLSLELIADSIVMIVNTVDNRYVEWHFEAACLEVVLNGK
jgi:hypothetical protein